MSDIVEKNDNSLQQELDADQSKEIAVPAELCNDKVNIKQFQWFYERRFDLFFEYVKAKSKTSVTVRCLLCPPQKFLTVTVNSAFNLNSHIKSIHQAENVEFEEKTKKRKSSDDITGPKQKQLKLDEFRHGGFVNQARLDKLVLNHIIDRMLSFSTVESESFKELVLTGNSSTLIIMTRVKLVDSLLREYQILRNGQIDEFSKIEYFCLTADLWSSRRRAFLGITIHWICPQSYSRKRDVLACRRITGKHTGEVLAANIDEIIKAFRIPVRKIVKIITDGGSNFKKAFKDHQVEDEILEEEDDEDSLTEILNDTGNDIFLPPHGRCRSHSLCLVLTSDIKLKKEKKAETAMKANTAKTALKPKTALKAKTTLKAKTALKFKTATKAKTTRKRKMTKPKVLTPSEIEFQNFRKNLLDPVLKKCQDLFNKQSNSPKAADLVKSYLNRYLITPSPTRWNSLYDSLCLLSTLIEQKPNVISDLINKLGLEQISSNDHAVLKEYIKITENVADALDVLQGEVYMYQGVYYPTIHKMKANISDISGLSYCEPLKQRILESIEKRFPDYMKDDYLKAALLHPLFKSYHIPTFTKERLMSELAVELQEVMDKSRVDKPVAEDEHKNRADIEHLKTFQRLFDYDVVTGFSGSKASSTINAEVLLHNYISTGDASIESLKNFPEIGKLFIKYNTVLCSSAACERLFSLAKHVLRAERCQLKDDNFEAQLIMKATLYPSKIKVQQNN